MSSYRARVGRGRSERSDRISSRSESLPSTSKSIPTRQLRHSTELRCSHPSSLGTSQGQSSSQGSRKNGASKGKDPSKTHSLPSTSKDYVDTCTIKTENEEEKEKSVNLLMDVSEQEGDDTEDDDGDREPGFERDSDTEDMEASGEEGDRLSEMSDSFNSSLLYRSRIPVPIAGSFGKHMVSIFNFRPLI